MIIVEVVYLYELKVKMSFFDKKINFGFCMVDDFLWNCFFFEIILIFILIKFGRKYFWFLSMFILKMVLKK